MNVSYIWIPRNKISFQNDDFWSICSKNDLKNTKSLSNCYRRHYFFLITHIIPTTRLNTSPATTTSSSQWHHSSEKKKNHISQSTHKLHHLEGSELVLPLRQRWKDAVVTNTRRPQLIYLRDPALRLLNLRQGRAPPCVIPAQREKGGRGKG